VAGVTLAANLGSFGFLVLVARSANPAVLGSLLGLAAVALIFEVPANALQAAVGSWASSAAMAPADQEDRRLLAARRFLLVMTAWGTGACLVLLAISPLLERLLHLPSLYGALLLGAYALPVAIGVAPKGLLTARSRLGTLALGLFAGIGVRLGAGVALVRGGAGVTGAIGAMVAGEAVAATVLLVSLGLQRRGVRAVSRDEARQEKVLDGQLLRWGEAKGPALAFTGYWALSAVDVVLARHWLGPLASGWYAAAATAAQLALIVPGAVAALSFPKLASIAPPRPVSPENRPWQRLTFALASAVVAFTGFAAAVAVSASATPLADGLFGDAYRPASAVVGLLSFGAAVLGLVNVLVHYHLNRGLRGVASLCWLGVVAVVAGTAAWHASMTQVALVMVASSSAVCAAMLAAALGHRELRREGLVEQAQLALLDAELDLTVVVPYYNPCGLLVPTIERLLSVLDGSGATYEVIAVSDGSTDGSDGQLDLLAAHRAQLSNLVLAHNQGKGAALRVGLARGRGRYLGFIDADGDLDPVLLESFQAMVRLYGPDIILGSKRHPLSEVEYPFIRRVYSWGYQQVVRLGFRLNIRDTQTGIKLVRRDVLAAVLPRMVEKRFAFDLELFVIARRLGYKRFLEAPIRLRHQFTSTVSWRAVYRSLLDTAAIWYRLRVLRFYDGEQAPATPVTERLRIDPVVLRGSAGVGAGSTNSPGRPESGRPDLSDTSGVTPGQGGRAKVG
jgi:glycosyltransferase involved in cell wall biosynthesis/O-antigen/teichoic acid export membrane protein